MGLGASPPFPGRLEGLAVGLGVGAKVSALLGEIGSPGSSIFGGAVYAVSRIEVAVM